MTASDAPDEIALDDAAAPPPDFGLDGILNFRDFGGHASTHGGAVMRGRLFRSANLYRATEDDHARLRALGVRVVVDLRRSSERESEPSRWAPDASPRTITSDDAESNRVPLHLQYLQGDGPVTAQHTHDYMITAYERIPFEERHIAMYREAFAALAANETPFLVHCAAGKDRTGVFCALVLRVLGVAPGAIEQDYLRTNTAPGFEDVVARAAVRFSKRFNRSLDAEDVRPMMAVDGAYLEAAWATIETQCGSVDAYLMQTLGVDEAMQTRLRKHFIQPE